MKSNFECLNASMNEYFLFSHSLIRSFEIDNSKSLLVTIGLDGATIRFTSFP